MEIQKLIIEDVDQSLAQLITKEDMNSLKRVLVQCREVYSSTFAGVPQNRFIMEPIQQAVLTRALPHWIPANGRYDRLAYDRRVSLKFINSLRVFQRPSKRGNQLTKAGTIELANSRGNSNIKIEEYCDDLVVLQCPMKNVDEQFGIGIISIQKLISQNLCVKTKDQIIVSIPNELYELCELYDETSIGVSSKVSFSDEEKAQIINQDLNTAYHKTINTILEGKRL